MKWLLTTLRPDPEAIMDVVHAEMKPARYSSFKPITAGPLVAFAGLATIGILGLLLAPIRLLKNFRSL